MERRTTIRRKILIFLVIPALLIYATAFTFYAYSHRQMLIEQAIDEVRHNSLIIAQNVEAVFKQNETIASVLIESLSYKSVEEIMEAGNELLPPIIIAGEQIQSVWVGMVPPPGRTDGLIVKHTNRGSMFDAAKPGEFEFHAEYRAFDSLFVRNPFLQQEGGENILVSTLAHPLEISFGDRGILGIDIDLYALQPVLRSIEMEHGAIPVLVSSNGTIAARAVGSQGGIHIRGVVTDESELEVLLHAVRNGIAETLWISDPSDGRNFILTQPVQTGVSTSPWSILVALPYSEIESKANSAFIFRLSLGLVGIFLLLLFWLMTARKLKQPIKPITNALRHLAEGEVTTNMTITKTPDKEYQSIVNSINTIVHGLTNKVSFIQSIEAGNLNTEVELLSEKDTLGNSLASMQKKLEQAQKEQAKQQEKEKKTAWANEGYALFANVLQNTEDLEVLTADCIKHMVKYLDVNQGALFLAYEEKEQEPFLELTATFAWNRHKFLNKRLAYGESLAGSCMLEKQTIVLKEIPEDYVTIASGLGEANPNCIVVVPLKHESKVLGVLELASFRVLDDHEVHFANTVAENIASAILSVRMNEQTKALLEQSRQQSEEMTAQEEEMRQNMEELTATQEELENKETLLRREIYDLKQLLNNAEAKHEEVVVDLKSEIEMLTLELKVKEKSAKGKGSAEQSKSEPEKEEPTTPRSSKAKRKPAQRKKGDGEN